MGKLPLCCSPEDRGCGQERKEWNAGWLDEGIDAGTKGHERSWHLDKTFKVMKCRRTL